MVLDGHMLMVSGSCSLNGIMLTASEMRLLRRSITENRTAPPVKRLRATSSQIVSLGEHEFEVYETVCCGALCQWSLISRYGGMTVRRRRDLHTRPSAQFRASEVDMRVVMAVRTWFELRL